MREGWNVVLMVAFLPSLVMAGAVAVVTLWSSGADAGAPPRAAAARVTGRRARRRLLPRHPDGIATIANRLA
jgi:hypothetical protein